MGTHVDIEPNINLWHSNGRVVKSLPQKTKSQALDLFILWLELSNSTKVSHFWYSTMPFLTKTADRQTALVAGANSVLPQRPWWRKEAVRGSDLQSENLGLVVGLGLKVCDWGLLGLGFVQGFI